MSEDICQKRGLKLWIAMDYKLYMGEDRDSGLKTTILFFTRNAIIPSGGNEYEVQLREDLDCRI